METNYRNMTREQRGQIIAEKYKIIKNDNGIRGFSYSGQCSQSTKARENIFYQVNNFDAFRIKNGKIICILNPLKDSINLLF